MTQNNFGKWFEELSTGTAYEYIGESYAQFAGNVEVACIRDLAGNEKQPALCDFHEKYTLMPSLAGPAAKPIMVEIWNVGKTCAAECRFGGDDKCDLFDAKYVPVPDENGIWVDGRCPACLNAGRLAKQHTEADRLDNLTTEGESQ